MLACPSEELIDAYVRGSLPTDVRAEVEAHLDACPLCRDAVVHLLEMTDHEPETETTLEVGDRLGRYQLAESLGRGAMGEVFAAFDTELHRTVAVKVLHARDDATSLLREARALARVWHPNVVAVHDVDIDHDRVFLAMELVRGQTLAQWLTSAPRSSRDILDVFRQAAQGLSAVHAAGLVHRDIKPDNILIGRDGRVRLTDFGLVQPRSVRREEVTQPSVLEATCEGTPSLAGTPAYMAPELFNGSLASERSDQFALAVTLYQALFGHRPFAGSTITEVVLNASKGRFRPRARTTRVPRRIGKALRIALSPRPEDRFDSVASMFGAMSPALPRTNVVSVALTVVAVASVSLAGLQWANASDSPRSDHATVAMCTDALSVNE